MLVLFGKGKIDPDVSLDRRTCLLCPRIYCLRCFLLLNDQKDLWFKGFVAPARNSLTQKKSYCVIILRSTLYVL